MSIAQPLKSEIQRLSRRELKTSVSLIHASNISLKKTVADLKKRIAALETGNKRLPTSQKFIKEQQQAVSPEKVRITAKSIRALRNKLGLFRSEFGKLIGVLSQNVFFMEHRTGRLKMRKKTLANILAIRGIGKREAKKRLEKMEGNPS